MIEFLTKRHTCFLRFVLTTGVRSKIREYQAIFVPLAMLFSSALMPNARKRSLIKQRMACGIQQLRTKIAWYSRKKFMVRKIARFLFIDQIIILLLVMLIACLIIFKDELLHNEQNPPIHHKEVCYLTLQRETFTHKAVIGELRINTLKECETLENFRTLIPPGLYIVQLTYSARFKKIMPLVIVPNRIGIRIHKGYRFSDSKGCILVGREINSITYTLKNSDDAFNSVLFKITQAERNDKLVLLDVID